MRRTGTRRPDSVWVYTLREPVMAPVVTLGCTSMLLSSVVKENHSLRRHYPVRFGGRWRRVPGNGHQPPSQPAKARAPAVFGCGLDLATLRTGPQGHRVAGRALRRQSAGLS